jgi:hypothetical protein
MLLLYLGESADLGFDFVSKKPYIYRINKKERALRLSMSKLMPTDGWEHFEQPIRDSPLDYILMLLRGT